MTRPVEVTPTSAHRVGLSVERRARQALQAAGWVVCRSWMSRSAVDLLAVRAGDRPLLIQARAAGRISPADRTRLLELAGQADGVAVVVGLHANGALAWHRLTGPGPRDREPLNTHTRVVESSRTLLVAHSPAIAGQSRREAP